MAIEPSLLDACITHLKTCLKNIHKVIQKANEILCSISQPSVCSEVLLSPRGGDYISGVVEVYRLSKRMEGGMRTRNIDCERLRRILRDIELSWNNLQAFLSICPSLLQTLPSSSVLDYASQGAFSDSTPCLQSCCGVCLLDRPVEEHPSEVNTSMLNIEGRSYHPSCANFWLHCVDPCSTSSGLSQ
ncbi:synergin gamma-like isoform X1 [Bufo gargarizans]|uniref:synergin gamma-like isoform X1 n=1 Tax=Bufo gargarizans TaxID=30331 RepID=UPI001CF2AB3A|nr:synergin gamma-like isoform X1 [Bufo gargarizans]